MCFGIQILELSDSNCKKYSACYAYKYKGKTLKCQQGIRSHTSSITELQNNQFEFTKWEKPKLTTHWMGFRYKIQKKRKLMRLSKETSH